MALQLPQEEREAIAQAEQTGDYTSEAYLSAIGHYMQILSNDQTYARMRPNAYAGKDVREANHTR